MARPFGAVERKEAGRHEMEGSAQDRRAKEEQLLKLAVKQLPKKGSYLVEKPRTSAQDGSASQVAHSSLSQYSPSPFSLCLRWLPSPGTLNCDR